MLFWSSSAGTDRVWVSEPLTRHWTAAGRGGAAAPAHQSWTHEQTLSMLASHPIHVQRVYHKLYVSVDVCYMAPYFFICLSFLAPLHHFLLVHHHCANQLKTRTASYLHTDTCPTSSRVRALMITDSDSNASCTINTGGKRPDSSKSYSALTEVSIDHILV